MAKHRKRRDVVLPCTGGSHKVRLAKGRRFWANARCPVCRSAVDPRRLGRILGWLSNLRYPASPRFPHRAVWWGTMAYLVLALGAWILIWGLGDRWWPATVLLFGPRWTLLLPLVVLLPFSAWVDRALVVPLMLAALVVWVPVMGYRTSLAPVLPSWSDEEGIQVVTFNARGGDLLLTSPGNLIREWNADIAAFQECGPTLAALLREMPGWHSDARSGLCLLTRFQILEVMEMDRESLEFAGGAGVVVTYRLDWDGAPFYLTNLHLETPRRGFELIRSGQLRAGVAKVREKSILRAVELRRARRWTDRFEGPHIVVGDFNTPSESRAYRESWAGWQNAFSRKGFGFGGTRLNGWIRVRIDHILANDGWKVLDARLEGDAGSDHLPMAALLRLRP